METDRRDYRNRHKRDGREEDSSIPESLWQEYDTCSDKRL
jgi:hypothetical protein